MAHLGENAANGPEDVSRREAAFWLSVDIVLAANPIVVSKSFLGLRFVHRDIGNVHQVQVSVIIIEGYLIPQLLRFFHFIFDSILNLIFTEPPPSGRFAVITREAGSSICSAARPEIACDGPASLDSLSQSQSEYRYIHRQTNSTDSRLLCFSKTQKIFSILDLT